MPPGGNLFPLLLVCLIAEELFHELVVNRDELFFIVHRAEQLLAVLLLDAEDDICLLYTSRCV